MATRYWVGGSGDWASTTKWSATSGGASGASVPTSSDDVIINSSSGSPTITTTGGTRSCLTLTTTGATCTFSTSGFVDVYGNATLSSTTTFSTATLRMRATGTLSQNGATLSSGLTITAGAAGVVTLGSNLATGGTSDIELVSGTLNTSTSNYSITCDELLANNSTTARGLTLNASTVNVVTWTMGSLSGLTISAGTSTINCAGGDFDGGGKTYATVIHTVTDPVIDYAYTISGANAFTTFTLRNNTTVPVNVDAIIGSNQTVTGTFTASCNSSNKRLRLLSSSMTATTVSSRTTQVTITAGTTSLSYVDFRGIVGAGTAAWTGTSLGNIENNSGITFTAAVTRYAKAVNTSFSGYTSGFNKIGWSATNGGATGASIPLPQDTVYFTSSAGAGTYLIDNLICAQLICTGFTQTITNTINLVYCYGNAALDFGAGGTYSSGDGIVLRGTGTQTITANNSSVRTTRIQAITGTYSLVGNFTCGDNFNVDNGTFTVGAYNFTTSEFLVTTTDTAAINMGSGTWTLTGSVVQWSISNPSATLNKQTANIVIDATDTGITFAGNGLDYPKITFANATAGQTITFSGDNTIAELASTKTVAYTLRFTAGSTTTISAFTVSGTAGNVVTITSTTTSRATLIKGTPWNVGVNSTSSNSSGINLVAGDGVDYLAFSYITALPQASSFLIMF